MLREAADLLPMNFKTFDSNLSTEGVLEKASLTSRPVFPYASSLDEPRTKDGDYSPTMPRRLSLKTAMKLNYEKYLQEVRSSVRELSLEETIE